MPLRIYYYLLQFFGPLIGLLLGFVPRFKNSSLERNGFGVWKSLIASKGNNTAWFHAASLGEVAGLEPLLKSFTESFPSCEVLVSTTSETGKAAAEKLGYRAALLPFDYPQAVSRVVSRLRPSLLIVSETEIWPVLYTELERRGIPIVIVNGRISDYSWPRYQKLKFLLSPLFAGVKLLAAQSETDAERYMELGVDSKKIAVTGSSKYDRISNPTGLPASNDSWDLESEGMIFVAGSVRPGEVEIIVEAYLLARESCPSLQLILTPRHPEEFAKVAELLTERGIDFNRRSEKNSQKKRVLLLDTIGELGAAYHIGQVAFVGATLVDIGGHNPLEPAAASCVVMVGPYTSNIEEEIALLKESDAALQVKTSEDISKILLRLSSDKNELQLAGAAAKNVWQESRGATSRVIALLGAVVGQSNAADYSLKQSFALRILFLISSSIFLFVSSLRNRLFDCGLLRSFKSELPVISVGNLTVGGSGKTPITGFLAAWLIDQGYSPVILSRGYKGSKKGPHLVKKTDKVSEVGDESLMQVQKLFPKVQVVVAKQRAAGARFITQKKLGDIILLDDGYQHRWLKRDLNILLVDPSEKNFLDSWTNPKLLPQGRFREQPWQGIKRADMIIFVIRRWLVSEDSLKKAVSLVQENCSPPALGFVQLDADQAFSINGKHKLNLDEFDQVSVLTALAEPDQFAELLRKQGLEITGLEFFPDHYRWSLKDWGELSKRLKVPILVTEKDAIKITHLSTSSADDVWVVPLQVKFFGAETNSTLLRLMAGICLGSGYQAKARTKVSSLS